MTKMNEPSVAEERKWRAEGIVRASVEKTPEFKKAVRQTANELKKMEANIKVTPKKRR